MAFDVGDRVRVKDSAPFHGGQEGWVMEVVGGDENQVVTVRLDSPLGGYDLVKFHSSQLELVSGRDMVVSATRALRGLRPAVAGENVSLEKNAAVLSPAAPPDASESINELLDFREKTIVCVADRKDENFGSVRLVSKVEGDEVVLRPKSNRETPLRLSRSQLLILNDSDVKAAAKALQPKRGRPPKG